MKPIATAKASHGDIEATIRLVRDEQGFVLREGFLIKSTNQTRMAIHRLYETRKNGQWGEPLPLRDKKEALRRFEMECANYGATYHV